MIVGQNDGNFFATNRRIRRKVPITSTANNFLCRCPTSVSYTHLDVYKRQGLSNLNRQILYSEADLGKPKANQAAQRLQQQSPQTTFTVYPEFLTPANVNTILPGYDVVVDCLDTVSYTHLDVYKRQLE